MAITADCSTFRLRSLMDLVTGKYRHIKEQNVREALLAIQRDKQEKDNLIFGQLDQRRVLQRRIMRLRTFKENRTQILSRDIQQYKEIRAQKRDIADFREKMQNRTREGPGLER